MRISQRLRIQHFGVLAAVAMVGTSGCSNSDKPAYPVEIEVFVQGKPANGATVVLHPVGTTDPNVPLPSGKVDAAGTVKLSTFAQDDGAPPGDYTITVEWREERIVTIGSDKVREFSADKLKGKYRKTDAPTTPRATIQKQPNKLPPLQL
jgi:hypothetical protein